MIGYTRVSKTDGSQVHPTPAIAEALMIVSQKRWTCLRKKVGLAPGLKDNRRSRVATARLRPIR